MSERRLRRSPDQKILGGVIGGLAEYFDRDAALLRLLYILVSVISGGVPRDRRLPDPLDRHSAEKARRSQSLRPAPRKWPVAARVSARRSRRGRR